MSINNKFLYACFNGNLKKVKRMANRLVFKPNLNWLDPDKNTPLHAAIMNDHYEIARFLIDKGVNINARQKAGLTPLHIAAGHGNFEIAKLLIEKGAEINVQLIENNETTLNLALTQSNDPREAIKPGHKQVAELLINSGIDVNLRGFNGHTALWLASYFSRIEIAELLIKKGADINVKDDKGDSAYNIARRNGHKRMAKLLIDYGANPNT